MEEKTYCVYVHTSKIDGRKYIGITSEKNPKSRWRDGNGYQYNKLFYNYIKKYGWNIFDSEILFAGLTKEHAEIKEIELIGLHKSNIREFGFNIENGGSGRGRMSESTKKILSELNSGDKNPHYGKQRTKNTIDKIKNTTKNKIYNMQKENNPSSKKVIQYDVNMNKIALFNYVGEVADLGYNPDGVSNCCLGKTNTYKGFVWKYENESDIESINRKNIIQYDMNYNLVKIWDSALKASREGGYHRRYIAECCNGVRHSYRGYIWKYGEINFGTRIKRIKIDCNSTNEFNSIHEASRLTNVSRDIIYRCLNSKNKNHNGYRWEYC